MNDTQFISDLSSIYANIRKLDARKINLKGKNILDYINKFDARDPELKDDEVDIWNTEISLNEEGHIEVKPLEHTAALTELQMDLFLNNTAKVINNEVFDENDNHVMYWQTDGLTDSYHLIPDSNGNDAYDYFLFSIYDFSNDSMTGNTKLTTFESDLSNLTNGYGMFAGTPISYFKSNLNSLMYGDSMFCMCPNLTIFDIETPSMTEAWYMFSGSNNLTSFKSNLKSLLIGDDMFAECKLDAPSVANIIYTLPTLQADEISGGEGYITIGIGCDDTEEDKELFAQECDCETWQELLDDFSAKNWTVDFQFNGRPTATYNMRRGETLPIYTKLVEVTDNKKIRYAKYTSADGSKFFNIRHFHSTNGSTEGYDVFSSLEEAINSYGITPKN